MWLISQSVDHTSHDAYFKKAYLNVSYRCDYSWHTATTPDMGLPLARCVAVPKVGDYSWHGTTPGPLAIAARCAAVPKVGDYSWHGTTPGGTRGVQTTGRDPARSAPTTLSGSCYTQFQASLGFWTTWQANH